MNAVHHYVPRPPAIATQAVQWRGDINDLPTEWLRTGAFTHTQAGDLLVTTLDGERPVDNGDYIVRGAAGDFFPVPEGDFHAAYLEVAQP